MATKYICPDEDLPELFTYPEPFRALFICQDSGSGILRGPEYIIDGKRGSIWRSGKYRVYTNNGTTVNFSTTLSSIHQYFQIILTSTITITGMDSDITYTRTDFKEDVLTKAARQ